MKKIAAALEIIHENLLRREDIGAIIESALIAADPYLVEQENLEINAQGIRIVDDFIPLESDGKLILVSLGKAAEKMMLAALDVLHTRVEKAVCVCKHPEGILGNYSCVQTVKGDHPIPGEGSLEGGKAIRDVVIGLGEKDLVLLLISGGGSALATLPVEGVLIKDMQIVTDALLRQGKTINEMNAVRKHLDQIKGGGLLRLAAPARVASLILSDVVGNPLDVIASGPTVPDPSSFKDALRIVEDVFPVNEIPSAVFKHLQDGVLGTVRETIKPGEENNLLKNALIGSNQVSCAAAMEKATSLGFDATVVSTSFTGEARLAGEELVRIAGELSKQELPALYIFGGETIVKIKGGGLGGRNLETALSAVKGMSGLKDVCLVTFGTDGEDGPTDAAGAVITDETFLRAQTMGLNPDSFLETNDSYHFFEKMGNLLITGATGTNVNDISFLFKF